MTYVKVKLFFGYLLVMNFGVLYNIGMGKGSSNLQTWNCLSHKTITVASDGVISNSIQYGLDGLFFHMKDMLENEHCFTFYLYSSNDQRFIRWMFKDKDLLNRIEANNLFLKSRNDTLQVIEKYRDSKSQNFDSDSKTTKHILVMYSALSDLYERNQAVFNSLRNLQIEHEVDVIIVCTVVTCPKQGEEWIPYYRIPMRTVTG